MIQRDTNSSAFGAGITTVVIGGWLAALAFFASLLPWRIGVWVDTEPMVLAMHASALSCTVGLAVCAWARPGLVRPVLAHPAVLAAVFVAVWTLIAAPFVAFPFLSFLGAPQLGEGGLFYAECAVLLAGGMLLGRWRRAKVLFVAPAIAVCVAVPVIVAIGARIDPAQPWWLFKFDDYLAWYAVIGATLVLALRVDRLVLRYALALLVAAPGLAVSGNLSAIAVILAIAFPVAVGAELSQRQGERLERWVRRSVAVSIPALAMAGVLAVWVAGEAGLVASLVSRLNMYRTLLATIGDDPAILAVGQGWGQINIAVLLHLADSGAVIWDGSWDLSARDIPHSHNFAVEALLGGGIPAALGSLAMVAALPLLARRRNTAAASFSALAFSGIGAMWFQLPATSALAMMALGLAGGPVSPRRRRHRARFVGAPAILALLAALALAQAACLYWLADYALSARQARLAGYQDLQAAACGDFPQDAMRGSIGLAQQFDTEMRAALSGGIQDETQWQALRRLHCVVARRAAEEQAPRLMLADLLFRGQVANDPALAEIRNRFADAIATWRPALERFVATAPGRTEVAVPYLTWLLTGKRANEVVSFAELLLHQNPDDPIGHWFLGVGLSGLGGPMDDVRAKRIIDHMRDALDLGVQNLIEVDPVLIRFIEEKSLDQQGR